MSQPFPLAQPTTLARWVRDARARTCALVADLSDEQLMAPPLEIINPLLWEIGHIAWFQEKWVLRHAAKRTPLMTDADELYDSIAIAHDRRWNLPLPTRMETLTYLRRVRDAVLDLLATSPTAEQRYFAMYTVFHEDMHTEAFIYTRQTLGVLPPCTDLPGDNGGSYARGDRLRRPSKVSGDVKVAGGRMELGASPGTGFVFDNEKWAHPVDVAPFRIARAAVTQQEFACFVEDGGYDRPELWGVEGRNWLTQSGRRQPVYWRPRGRRWQRRHFNRWVDLEPDLPVAHVCWHEADAYCRWSNRRLPTEQEWELAASGFLEARSRPAYPWGTTPVTPDRARFDGLCSGCVDVHALSEGDSPHGCRQMLGNVWEWTASCFMPYPGFVADAYHEYSEPWFGERKVLRGGSWASCSRMLRTTWRNFFTPDRADVIAGFRTCAR